MLSLRFRMLAFCAAVSGLGSMTYAHRVVAEPAPPDLGFSVLHSAKIIGLVDTVPTAKRSLTASLRRTPCFGSCPVFLVEVWSDGQVVWHGERHVTRLGVYTAHVSAEWITELVREAERAGFFDLASQYPSNGRLVADLPSTITMLRRGHHEHRVTDNADAPLALLRFEQYWQEKLEALHWKPVTQ